MSSPGTPFDPPEPEMSDVPDGVGADGADAADGADGADGAVAGQAPDEEGVPPEIVRDGAPVRGGDAGETVEHPAKVMRIASMIKQLLEEVRQAPLDEAGRLTLREIYQTSVRELAASLSPDLRDELARVTLPFADRDAPTEPELRIAQAQLVGWLDGLFHGIQATVFAQQMAARAQVEGQRGLPPGAEERMQRMRPPGYL